MALVGTGLSVLIGLELSIPGRTILTDMAWFIYGALKLVTFITFLFRFIHILNLISIIYGSNWKIVNKLLIKFELLVYYIHIIFLKYRLNSSIRIVYSRSGFITISSGNRSVGLNRDDSLMINQLETLSLNDSNSVNFQSINYPGGSTSFESNSIISGISVETAYKNNLFAPSTAQGSSLDTDIRELLRQFKPNPWPRSLRSNANSIRDRPRPRSSVLPRPRPRSSVSPRSSDIRNRRKNFYYRGIEFFFPIRNYEKNLVWINYILSLCRPCVGKYAILIDHLTHPRMGKNLARRYANVHVGFLTKRNQYLNEKSYLFTLEEHVTLIEEISKYTSDLQLLAGPMKRSFSDAYTTSEIVQIVANCEWTDTFSSEYTEFLNKYLEMEKATSIGNERLNEGGRVIEDQKDPRNLELLLINSNNFKDSKIYLSLYR